ncbi:Small-conductance mechanosensitive channel [Sulfitobacter brevis]|uniref:Small-conductance mechanosensitive channel n=1 Tax=Sulfitobacter brevis TaxID=74348 RepID=A0A1I1T9X8_9RHOB|nr:mechanosensitive ion channel family protein [Sulfitobacter brevis]SFD55432.1 Small-conductance mechanosensitive channel [Sulfitobacter brevis]
MRRLLSGLVLFFLVAMLGAGPSGAQAISSLLADRLPGALKVAPDPQTNATETARASEKAGIQVIVVDSAGKVLATNVEDLGAAPDEQEALDPAEGKEPASLMRTQERADAFRNALVDRISLLPSAFNEVVFILRATSPDGTIMAFVKILLLSLLMLAAGVVVERQIYGKRVARRWVVARVQDNPQGYAEKMPFLLFRFFMGVIGILVSMTVAYILGFALFGGIEDTAVQLTVTLINIGYFSCRFVAGVWRMILSPFMPQYRIPTLSDRDAKRLHRWLWMMGCFDICAIIFGLWIGELGLNYEIYALVASTLSLVLVLANMLLVVVNRRAINHALRHGKPYEKCSVVTRFICRVWAPAVFVYVIFAWFELTYDLVLGNPSSIPLIAGAYGILVSIIVVYGLINYVIERSFARARTIRLLKQQRLEREMLEEARAEAEAMVKRQQQEDGPDEDLDAVEMLTERAAPAALSPQEISAVQDEIIAARAEVEPMQDLRPTLNSFEALAQRVAGILAFVAGAYAFFYIWDNEGAQMVESYADQTLDIMVIVFLGYIAYHAFRIWIDNKIADETPDDVEVELGDEGGGSSASRLATLLPLFRNAVLIVVVVTILLIVLMEIGVNVGPLFAGAGIVGVAIGFGSQALVRDIFAGAFFLFDDAFRKGEYLDVGGVKGTVEKISVRSFQLRHHLGYLHTIPFGELQVMTNFSRDWVMMKLPLRVTYDTDVEQVRKLVKKLGVDLLDDPVIGDNFLQPLKSQGVIEMQDSAMIIRVKFMTKPGDQWLVRKRVYEEIRSLFEREGIKFAHREVTVRLADGKVEDLTDEQRKAVMAAAQASPDIDPDLAEDTGADDR